MADSFLMQAVSDDDGELYTWTATSKDWAAAGFPGPGSALYVAVAESRIDPVAASVADGAVSTAKLADGAVTTAKLANDAITPAKLDANAGAYGTYALARAALTAGAHAAGDTFRIASRSSVGDGGEGEWRVVAIGSYVDNGGTVLTGGSFAALRKIEDEYNVAWFGTDGAAIQAAIDAVGITGTSLTGNVTTGGIVFIPKGEYECDVPITTYSLIELYGVGPASRLVESASFTGDDLLLLEKSPTGLDRYQGGRIHDLGFRGDNVGAIAEATPLTANSTFEDLHIATKYGIRIPSYAQKVEIRRVYSRGPLDQFIKLAGNNCLIEQLDKEASTGSSTEPYIHILAHSTTNSIGITLDHILIEGSGSANKTVILLDGVDESVINIPWCELTATDGYLLHFKDCNHCHVQGPLFTISETREKVKLENSAEITFEYVTTNGSDVPWWDMFEVDATSTIRIDALESRRSADLLPITNTRYSIGRYADAQRRPSGGTPNAAFPSNGQLIPAAAQNLLVNPSFEAGIHGWTRTGTIGTDEVIQSEVGLGLMLHYAFSGGNSTLYQSITIPAELVGVPLTLSFKCKFSGDGLIHPHTTGTGINTATAYVNYHSVSSDAGWHYITQTVIPQSAGTLQVGLKTSTPTTAGDIWVDDFCLAYGTVALGGGAGTFASLDLGSRTVTYGSAAPSTGTWKVGDLRLNSEPAVGEPVGWSCTVAGSPGTWERFGGIGSNISCTNNTSGGGNPTLFVAPDTAADFAQLADAAARTYDYDPGADGYYTLAYEFRLVTGGGSYRKIAVTQDFKRVSGVCSLEGSMVTLGNGVQTGLAVAFSIVSDDVRVTLTNTTGSTLDGHYWRSTLAGDLPA